MVMVGQGDFASQAVEGRAVITGGTGELDTLHGVLELQASVDPDATITYTGHIHFDRSGAASWAHDGGTRERVIREGPRALVLSDGFGTTVQRGLQPPIMRENVPTSAKGNSPT